MNLLLTGRPGIGKTTIMGALAEGLGTRGIEPGGFLAVEEREGDRRVGFRLTPLGGTDGKLMAHVDLISARRVGHYGIDVEIIDYVVDTCLRPSAEIVLIDEIGAMECASRRFEKRVAKVLDGPQTVVATIAARGRGFIAECKQRSDIELIEVDEENRDRLAAALLERLAAPR